MRVCVCVCVYTYLQRFYSSRVSTQRCNRLPALCILMYRNHEWVMSHIWIRHVTRVNESCHTYEYVMSHIWMSHVTHTNTACHTGEWVKSHICISHVTQVNESSHTYAWVMSHTPPPSSSHSHSSMSHVTHTQSCRTCEHVTSHVWMSHVTHMNESCHICE